MNLYKDLVPGLFWTIFTKVELNEKFQKIPICVRKEDRRMKRYEIMEHLVTDLLSSSEAEIVLYIMPIELRNMKFI